MTMNYQRARNAFVRAVIAAYDSTYRTGFLGRRNADSTVDLAVEGRPGYVWLTVGTQSVSIARNDADVPLLENLEVRFREENGTLVIQGRSGRGTFATAPAVLPGGEVGSFLYLTDTPAAYTGEAGKVVAVNATEDALEFVAGGGGGGGGVGEFDIIKLTPQSADYNETTAFSAIQITQPYLTDYLSLYVGVLGSDGLPTWGGMSASFGHDFGYLALSDFLPTIEANFTGPSIVIGRNRHATYPAAGTLVLKNYTGTSYKLWVDASGVLRLGTDQVRFDTDTGGVVVGSQTSSLDQKNVIEEFVDNDKALRTINETPLYRFRYKENRYSGQEFVGIVTDYAPIFGVDRDEAHPAGKSLNEVSAHGYAMAAIKALTQRVAELATRVEELEAQISGG